MNTDSITFGNNRLTIEDVVAIATGQKTVQLGDASFKACIDKGADFLDQLWKEEGVIYGVTTGYGDSCTDVVWAICLTKLRGVRF